MRAKQTEVAIKFKQAPVAMFRDTPVERLAENFLVLGIQPNECIGLEFNAKIPGPSITIGGVGMTFKYQDYFDAAPSTGYETLIYDCMIGDAILYPRADGIEAGWRVVQPFLDAWHEAPAERSRDLPGRQRRPRRSRRAARPRRPPLAADRVRPPMAARSHRHILIVDDAAALAETAARRLVARVDAQARAAVCLTGGSSPQGLYRLLGEAPWRGEVPWDRVHWFIGDDRFVPESDPLSNMGTARRLLLDRVGAPRQNIHPMRDRRR